MFLIYDLLRLIKSYENSGKSRKIVGNRGNLLFYIEVSLKYTKKSLK